MNAHTKSGGASRRNLQDCLKIIQSSPFSLESAVRQMYEEGNIPENPSGLLRMTEVEADLLQEGFLLDLEAFLSRRQIVSWLEAQPALSALRRTRLIRLMDRLLCRVLACTEACALLAGRARVQPMKLDSLLLEFPALETLLKNWLMQQAVPAEDGHENLAQRQKERTEALLAGALADLLYRSLLPGTRLKKHVEKLLKSGILTGTQEDHWLIPLSRRKEALDLLRQLQGILGTEPGKASFRAPRPWSSASLPETRTVSRLFLPQAQTCCTPERFREMKKALDPKVCRHLRHVCGQWFPLEKERITAQMLMMACTTAGPEPAVRLGQQINALLFSPALNSLRQQELAEALLLYAVRWLSRKDSGLPLSAWKKKCRKGRTAPVRVPFWVSPADWTLLLPDQQEILADIEEVLQDEAAAHRFVRTMFGSALGLKRSVRESLEFLAARPYEDQAAGQMPLFAAQMIALFSVRPEAVVFSPFLLLSVQVLCQEIELPAP